MSALATTQVRVRMWRRQTVLALGGAGVFFEDLPMRFYGGTVVAYAATFDLRVFLEKVLQTGVVSLNDEAHHCPRKDWPSGHVGSFLSTETHPAQQNPFKGIARITVNHRCTH